VLSNGYGYWKGSKYFDVPPIVGVYLTDPSRPDGLGDYENFSDLASNFDVVVRRDIRSARIESKIRVAGGMGNVAVRNGVEVNSTYDAMLIEAHNNIVSLAPPTEEAKRALQAVRDAVTGQEFDQADPNDPDLTVLATDFVSEDTQQWHDVLAAGLVGDGYYRQHGRLMTSMLVVAPYEAGDLGRKLVSSGVPMELTFDTPTGPQTFDNVDVSFALPELTENEDARSYALALSLGYIPHEALSGAEY
jgi:hypothetical protein